MSCPNCTVKTDSLGTVVKTFCEPCREASRAAYERECEEAQNGGDPNHSCTLCCTHWDGTECGICIDCGQEVA